MTDADLAVYEILDKTGGGLTLKSLADQTGLGETQIRGSLKWLADQGLIETTGRKGKSLLWKTRGKFDSAGRLSGRVAPKSDDVVRLSPSNQQPTTTDHLEGDRVAADRRIEASEDDLPEPSPEEKAQWLEYADAFLDRLADLPEPDLGDGVCGECEQQARRRWTLGHFELCRACRTRRRRVQMMLDLTDQQRRTLTDALAEAAKLRLADD